MMLCLRVGCCTRHHPFRHFTTVQKAAKASHLPNFEILACRFIKHTAGRIGSDIENQYLNWADGGFNLLNECDHFLFLARIAAKSMADATFSFNGVFE